MSKPVKDNPELVDLISNHYEVVPPIRCSPIQKSFHEHSSIEVRGREQRFLLRIYGREGEGIDTCKDLHFEVELLAYLDQCSLPVAAPVRRRDGKFLGGLQSTDGERPFALFHFVPGTPIYANEEVKDPVAACQQLGALVARLHLAADQFQPQGHQLQGYRRVLGTDALIDEPLRLLEEALVERGKEGLDFFRPCGEELKAQIEQVPQTVGLHGLIHGDLHGENITYDRDTGFWFYDFEHCVYSWRAYELAFIGATFEELFRPFLDGYEEVRPIAEVEKENFMAFAKARAVWEVGDELRMATQRGSEESMGDLVERLRQKLETLV